MSKANAIAEALKARLQQVRRSGGYHTDVGARVYRGRVQLAEADIPCAVLFEGEEDAARPKGEPYTVPAVLHFIVEAHAPCAPENPDLAGHDLVEDLLRALFGGDPRLGGLLNDLLTYTGRVIFPREGGSGVVTVQIKLDAPYNLTPATP